MALISARRAARREGVAGMQLGLGCSLYVPIILNEVKLERLEEGAGSETFHD